MYCKHDSYLNRSLNDCRTILCYTVNPTVLDLVYNVTIINMILWDIEIQNSIVVVKGLSFNFQCVRTQWELERKLEGTTVGSLVNRYQPKR